MKEVVFSKGNVEQIAMRDPRWVLVVVLRVRCGDVDELRCELVGQAKVRQRRKRSCFDAIACETSLKLLICCQPAQVDVVLSVDDNAAARTVGPVRIEAGHRTSRQTAIEPPVEPDERTILARSLILQVGRLIEALVVIDAERKAALPNRSACACALRWEEQGSHTRHHTEGC